MRECEDGLGWGGRVSWILEEEGGMWLGGTFGGGGVFITQMGRARGC